MAISIEEAVPGVSGPRARRMPRPRADAVAGGGRFSRWSC